MDMNQLLVDLSKKLTDEGKLIEAGWIGLRLAAVNRSASPEQLAEMRMASRPHIGWRHKSNLVAERLKLARPMMRRGAGLDANQAWRQLLKERKHVPALQLTANDHRALCINAMNLKDRLRDVQTDCRNRLHS